MSNKRCWQARATVEFAARYSHCHADCPATAYPVLLRVMNFFKYLYLR